MKNIRTGNNLDMKIRKYHNNFQDKVPGKGERGEILCQRVGSRIFLRKTVGGLLWISDLKKEKY